MMPRLWALVEVASCIVGVAAIIVFILMLQGCAAKRVDKAQTDTIRQETTVVDTSVPFPVTTADGIKFVDVPIHVTMKRDSTEVAKTDATRTSTIDAPEIASLIKAGLAQFAPGLSALISVPKPKDYTGEVVTGGGAIMVLLMQYLKERTKDTKTKEVLTEKDRQIEFHRNDAAEAYGKLLNAPTDSDHA